MRYGKILAALVAVAALCGSALMDHAGQELDYGTMLEGEVTFCTDLVSARAVASAPDRESTLAISKQLAAQEKCGVYKGLFFVLDRKAVVNGLEIYEVTRQPSADHVFTFYRVEAQTRTTAK